MTQSGSMAAFLSALPAIRPKRFRLCEPSLPQRLQYLQQFPVHELVAADYMPGFQRIVIAFET
jgi:hypothetical protein